MHTRVTLFKARRSGSDVPSHGEWSMRIIPAVEHAVTRPRETVGYRGLQAEGMLDMAFEAVVLRHKSVFSSDAVKKSEERLALWRASGGD